VTVGIQFTACTSIIVVAMARPLDVVLEEG